MQALMQILHRGIIFIRLAAIKEGAVIPLENVKKVFNIEQFMSFEGS